MNKIIKIISFVIFIIAIIFAGYKVFFQKQKKEETEIIKAQDNNNSESKTRKEASLAVKVIKATRSDLPLRLRITGHADVWEKTTIKPEVSGEVKQIFFSVGEHIKKRQLLVKIDDNEIKLELERAKTNKLKALSQFLVKESSEINTNSKLSKKQKIELANLKKKYLNSIKDFRNGKINETQFEKISNDYESALVYSGSMREEIRKAQEGLSDAIISLKQSELKLKKTSIKSPFQGIISNINISKGEKINQGQEILKIVNLNSLYIKGFALESEIRNLRKDINVRIKFESFPDQYFYGKIEAISPEVDPDNKTITIYVKVDNKKNLIYPGMHAEMDIEYKVFKNTLNLPNNAIIVRQGRSLVFVVKDKIALWKYVEIGHHNDEQTEIIKGIEEGDIVVIEGQLTLAHQSKVKIIK